MAIEYYDAPPFSSHVMPFFRSISLKCAFSRRSRNTSTSNLLTPTPFAISSSSFTLKYVQKAQSHY